MAKFCLIKEQVDKFKVALRDGTINPMQMAKMNSVERREFLAKIVGKENASEVNALFESKLLLKNQKAGYISWAKKVSGISPEAKRDLISKIERMDKVLDPSEETGFLEDLASSKLGVSVSESEAKKIYELSKKVSELKLKTDPTKSDIKLGRAMLDVSDYVNSLSGKKADLITNVANVPRTLMTSLDLSAPLNQGWGMASRKQFYTSFARMFKYLRKESFRDLQAELITHPLYPTAKKAGLRLTDLSTELNLREEAFMSNLLDRVPGISHSQRGYTGFLNKLRMDVYSDLIKKAELSGENISAGSKSAEDIAKLVNNFTGGARVGKLEQSTPLLNALLFSPRKIMSTLQMMNPRNYLDPKISKTARKEATRNLIGSLALSASVIGLVEFLTGKKQERDFRSTDFGKIRSGDTRLDITGGNGAYAILLSRLLTQKMKTTSGLKDLGNKYGETSGFDLLANFTRNKLSPNASFFVDAVARSNALGQSKTIKESAIDRFKPIFANSIYELLKSDSDGKVAFALAGLFGAGLNVYDKPSKDWSESSSAELTQFKEKVGDAKFKQANDEFNSTYNAWLVKVGENPKYKDLSSEEQSKMNERAQDMLKTNIFKKYRFKYKTEKKTSTSKRLEKALLPSL